MDGKKPGFLEKPGFLLAGFVLWLPPSFDFLPKWPIPKTLEERRAVAGRCEAALQYGIRTYVDEMDDAVNKAYAAAPTRLYLVGLDGRVVYAGGLGPFGFKPAELGAAIEQYLAHLGGATD